MLLCLDYTISSMDGVCQSQTKKRIGSLAHVRGNEETLLKDFIIIINNKTKNKVSYIIIWASHDSRIFYSGLIIKVMHVLYFFICANDFDVWLPL